MEKTPPGSKPPLDDDGVRITRRPRLRRRATPVEIAACAVIAAGIALVVVTSGEELAPEAAVAARDDHPVEHATSTEGRRRRAETDARSQAAPLMAPSEPGTARPRLPFARRKGDPAPPAGEHPAAAAPRGEEKSHVQLREDEKIDARDYIEALRATGETGGIAAFPPPGTKPPMEGNVVPDGYRLPEGYVRHYQSTDDGKQLEPILMFSPDYDFFDADGNPIAIPKDRVVPPHMVPPDLPLRTLEVR